MLEVGLIPDSQPLALLQWGKGWGFFKNLSVGTAEIFGDSEV